MCLYQRGNPMRARPRSLLAASILSALVAPAALAQSAVRAQRFELTTGDEQPLRAQPLASQVLTVVLKMAGDPVAVVRSKAPAKQISETNPATTASTLPPQHDSL